MGKLELKHLAPYLPYGLKYYPSEKSDLFHDLYADNVPYSSWNYKLALEAKDDFALKISKSYLTQKEPFFAYENGEIFLGQFNSSLGFDVDDVFESEVKPILRPLSDLTKDENFELYMDLCEEIGVIRCDSLLEALEKGNYYAIDIQKYHILEEWLNKNHFDWKFGLIEKGLAIDINTLDK